ncbi:MULTISPECIES: radical SAM protein [Kosmotoga]|uniref:Radical SAM domain protein n=1 Tax=Kosmotoga olearia (strain ATCC BAA-1733 / DSM 21960 / TBF 19.5.1) TaxID=521045 RepID=C5CE91_KOSOT|nr:MULTISPECIES: radical SAM protein [Kosmotoga]ACR79199.1 Radical SAM domain protein [Kosmotoga olearia TBF 19.5.1]OAA23702.1 radical SAM protein [Kosmotoga sp. DU53]
MIRISVGTAKVMGLTDLQIDVLPTTGYFMIGQSCIYDCAFCSQSRTSHTRSDQLSRVTWPEYDLEQVMKHLSTTTDREVIRRICLQVVHQPGIKDTVQKILHRLSQSSELPICVCMRVNHVKEAAELIESGAERVCIALDAANPRVYEQIKNGSWHNRMKLIEEAAAMFPGHISTHLIVGLGETEKEMVETIQHMYQIGVTVGLFAFTPIRGTRMSKNPSPPLDQYRRIQVAHWLIRHGICDGSNFSYKNGSITGFGLSSKELLKHLADGEAFRTSGCPDCNRPYYNERPGGPMYNYPRPLTPDEITKAIAELKIKL